MDGSAETAHSILVVDDNLASRELMADMLRSKGYEPDTAADGPEALEIARRNQPDLVLLDVSMPEMDGFEVCRRLKDSPETAGIPIVFLTAKNETENIIRGFQLGAVDYVTKPFSAAELSVRVQNHLELKKSRDTILRINERLREEIEERKAYERKQEVNIDLARKVLALVSPPPPRYIDLPSGATLFVEPLAAPCYAEGGDHYLLRTLGGTGAGEAQRTVVSLKDQSGHEVSCMLKSILADLMHNAILRSEHGAALGPALNRLNREVCRSGLFDPEDFFTAINADFDHETFQLRHVSCGHPPMLLVRGDRVIPLPEPGSPGSNLPVAVSGEVQYSQGETQLENGDRLLLYTDGLTEMPLGNGGKPIQLDELIGIVQELLAAEPDMHVSQLAYKLLGHVAALSGEEVVPFARNTSADDVSLLGMEIEPPPRFQEEVWRLADTRTLCQQVTATSERLGRQWADAGLPDARERVRGALEEVGLNAWRHGNAEDGTRSIRLRWWTGNDFNFEMTDEGPGFDPAGLADPTTIENRARQSGRGIFMVQLVADAVRWRNGGRSIVVSFSRRRTGPAVKKMLRNSRHLMRLWD